MSEAFNRDQVDAILAPWLSLCKEHEAEIARLESLLALARDEDACLDIGIKFQDGYEKQRELMRAVVDSKAYLGGAEIDAMQAYLESEE